MTWRGSALLPGEDVPDRRLLGGVAVILSFVALVLVVRRYDVPLALAAGALLVGAIPLLRRPELATLLTVFLLYINVPAILTQRHGIPAAVAGSFILLLGIPLVRSLILKRESLKVDVTFALMLLLLCAYLLSSFRAVDPAIATDRILTYVVEGLLLYWLLLNSIRSLRTLRRVVWTLLLVGGVLGSLSVYQEVTGSYQKEFGGLAYRNFEETLDGQVREGRVKRETWHRAQGPLNEANRFAQVMIVLLPLAVYSYRRSRTWTGRFGAAGLGVMIFAGIVLTMSRGALVASVLMTFAMLALGWIRPSRLLVVVLLASLAGVGSALSMPFLAQRIESITEAGRMVLGDPASAARQADGAIVGRLTLMRASLHVFLDHPVVGVGPGQFPPFYSMDYSRSPDAGFANLRHGNWRGHSLYLELAAETGLIGLSVFLLIIGGLAWRLWRARRRWLGIDPDSSDLATALLLSLLAYLWTGIFLHLSYERYYWFLLALAASALHVIHEHRRVESGARPERRAPTPSALRT